jgi:hypothetical protein
MRSADGSITKKASREGRERQSEIHEHRQELV